MRMMRRDKEGSAGRVRFRKELLDFWMLQAERPRNSTDRSRVGESRLTDCAWCRCPSIAETFAKMALLRSGVMNCCSGFKGDDVTSTAAVCSF